jgi:hypothetical protein
MILFLAFYQIRDKNAVFDLKNWKTALRQKIKSFKISVLCHYRGGLAGQLH